MTLHPMLIYYEVPAQILSPDQIAFLGMTLCAAGAAWCAHLILNRKAGG